jgi:hypothetical protein
VLVLLSFGLVLVATVLLVLGLLVDSGLALIYGSIALSVIAAIVLFVAVRMSKPKAATSTAPALLRADPAPAPDAAVAAAAVAGAAAGGEWLAADQGWEDSDATWGGDEPDFPIAGYDELAPEEILTLLPQLYSDEISIVEARERAGQARPEVLDELARLRDGAAGDEQWISNTALPIEDYDALSVSEIVGVLGELDDDELTTVKAHEEANAGRRTILDDIDRRLGVDAEAAAGAPAPPSPGNQAR